MPNDTPSPGVGPRILFFSGGTALKDTARALTRYTHNSTHLITPFDSGGSSQTLRLAFAMPAVGDVRSRIMALADQDREEAAALHALFNHRLPEHAPEHDLKEEMLALACGGHLLVREIPKKSRRVICEHLTWLTLAFPEDFSLAGANVGNLFLAARYLRSDRHLRPAITLFSRLLRARGTVLPVVNAPAHLAVRLESGQIIVGQRNFTGKPGQQPPKRLPSPIADCWLTASENSPDPAAVSITSHIARRIREAEAICYPIGSFYSSVLANLLPKGVGRAVARNPGPKIFVPNLGTDPELLGHTLRMQVERLLRPLLADAPKARPSDMLSTVLVDSKNGVYPGGIPTDWLATLGIAVKHAPLVSRESAPLADAGLLAGELVSAFA